MEMMEVDDTECLAEFFVTEQVVAGGKKTFVMEKRTNTRMKPSTSKTTSSSTLGRRTSHSPPPDEPTAPYVSTDLPNPDDEPMLSDMRGVISSEEIERQKSQSALAKYNKALPEILAEHRAITAQLHQRYSEDEERKRIEQQKNKEAMTAATPISRGGGGQVDNRKRRNEGPSADEEWKRNQQWMGQFSQPHFQQQQQQQQQYMMMQQQQMGHHGMQMHHHMPSTSSADSVHSVPTPASMHQASPANTNGMNPPSTDRAMNEENLAVPEGDWFDELAVAVAKQYSDTVLGPDTYDVLTELDCSSASMKMSPATFSDRLPSVPPSSQPTPQQLHMQAQQEANKLRMLQMQQVEEQRQRQMQQQHLQQQQQRHQMLLHQQQMQQQQQAQPQMNGQFASQQAYMQQMRMQQMRYQQQHQQQAQQQQQQQQQQQMMGYGAPNGYPQQMHMHPSAYGHHMPATAFANMN